LSGHKHQHHSYNPCTSYERTGFCREHILYNPRGSYLLGYRHSAAVDCQRLPDRDPSASHISAEIGAMGCRCSGANISSSIGGNTGAENDAEGFGCSAGLGPFGLYFSSSSSSSASSSASSFASCPSTSTCRSGGYHSASSSPSFRTSFVCIFGGGDYHSPSPSGSLRSSSSFWRCSCPCRFIATSSSAGNKVREIMFSFGFSS
jgi:hypothetical protein